MFISSTFRDMNAEREELVERVFPLLRRMCEERGLSWSEIDLRWGITDEEVRAGRVVTTCLDEVDRCRPYFLCLLGDRYGWVVDSVDQTILTQHPWLDAFRERSVTELEIRHALHEFEKAKEHAFFYFRSGGVSVEPEPAESVEKLRALKAEILDLGLNVRPYGTIETLRDAVLDDFTAMLDRDFPRSVIEDDLDYERAAHQQFAVAQRLATGERPSYAKRLTEHANGAGPALVVGGPEGVGKTTLLAKWALSIQEAVGQEVSPRAPRWLGRMFRMAHEPVVFVVQHYTDALPSHGWPDAVARLIREARVFLGIDDVELPVDPVALTRELGNAMQMLARRGRSVIILDGADALRDPVSGYAWLPDSIPPQIRLIVAVRDAGPVLADHPSWQHFEIQPLSAEEKDGLVRSVLALHGKTLPLPLRQLATGVPWTDNAHLLRLVVDELRVFGDHFSLERRLRDYTTSETRDSLMTKVLERLEQSLGPQGAPRILPLIAVARSGLAESEILDLVGGSRRGAPLMWASMYGALRSSFADRGGVLRMVDRGLRDAVLQRYVDDVDTRRALHRTIGEYFSSRELSFRSVQEGPWNLVEAGDWTRAETLLADPAFFKAAWDLDADGVRRLWRRMAQACAADPYRAYVPLLSDESCPPATLMSLARFFRQSGRPEQALEFAARAAAVAVACGDDDTAVDARSNQAVILRSAGRLPEARVLLVDLEQTLRAIKRERALQRVLGNLAVIEADLGDFGAARARHQEQIAICRRLGLEAELQSAAFNQARVELHAGEWKLAASQFEEFERLARLRGDLLAVQAALGNRALLLRKTGRYSKAADLHAEEEAICRQLGDHEGLLGSLANQVELVMEREDFDGAMRLLEQQKKLCDERPGTAAEARHWILRARLLLHIGFNRDAVQAVETARTLADRHCLPMELEEASALLELLRGRAG